MTSAQSVTLTARGHPNVRATHAKTLEWVSEADLGPSGTCILGVGLDGDLEALARLRGRAIFRLDCGGRSERVEATLNPTWLPGEPPIVRTRAEPLARRTLAYAADKGAGALERAFAAGLADPKATLSIVVEPAGPPAPGALFLAQPDSPPDTRLHAARRLADLRLADLRVADLRVGDDPPGMGAVETAIAAGERVLLETADPALRAAAVARTRAAGGQVTLLGAWSPLEGAQALSGFAPAAWLCAAGALGAGKARRARLARLVHGAERVGAGLCLPLESGAAGPVLADLARKAGERSAALVADPGGPDEAVTSGTLSALASGRDPRRAGVLVLAGEVATTEDPSVDSGVEPALLALAAHLRAEGVATKTLAAALAARGDISKREAFNLLIKLEENGSSA